jgi:hypothetical protein
MTPSLPRCDGAVSKARLAFAYRRAGPNVAYALA